MEGLIAKWYAANTRNAMDEFRELARRLATEIPAGASVLEVAPGPGYLAIELAKRGYRMTGLDISKTFVEIARDNAAGARVAVEFREGNASGMPLESDMFDFIVCRAAFKNFADPVGALREMRRVLKRGAAALIIDLRRNASRDAIHGEVGRMGLNAVNAWITKVIFRCMLLRRAYTKEEMERLLAQCDFGAAQVEETPIGLEIRARK